uniref:F-box protein At3g07870-like n=1 Tax=Erigeron canadensis TaxID=72917 RepID=UPI001CB91B67|nr:F-box protein At3g07870-like [Erigeron canadensis]
MSQELPKDIIINDILSRVPARHILRFKSVCKSWYSLFRNPNFIIKHFQTQSFHSDPSFIFTPQTLSSSSSSPSDQNIGFIPSDDINKHIKIPIQIDIPFLKITKPLRVSGSCNGLVCLTVLPIASIILIWNPATRVFKDLPVSGIDRPRAGPIKVVLGFGFDELVDDYKVLRIVYYGYPLNQVEMYSLSTNSWKEIKTRVRFLIVESASSVFLNGRFHWNAIGFEERQGKKVIVCFDFRDEAFRYIMPPEFDFDDDDDDDDSKVRWNVVVVEGLLGVIGMSGKRFQVWVMNEYGVVSSWMKYREFELEDKVGRMLGCGLKREFLLEKEGGQLVVYDSDSQRVTNLGDNGVAYWSDVFNHVGSLLPIKGGKVARRTNLSDVVPDAFFVRMMDLTI